MKKGLFFLFIILWVAFNSFSVHQNEETLHLLGWVIKDEKPMRRASVGVWHNNELIHETHTNRWGHFSMDMPLEENFTLTFSAEGHVTKRISVDTRTSSAYKTGEYLFFEFEVEMLEEAPWIRKDFFEDPVAIVFYDSYEHLFGYDRQYFAFFQARFEEMKNPGVVIPAASYMASLNSVVSDVRRFTGEQPEQPAQGTFTAAALDQVEFPLLPQQAMTPVFNTPTATVASTETKQDQEEEPIRRNTSMAAAESAFADIRYATQEKVFFSVQVLATARPISKNYFHRLENQFPGVEILYFKDEDNLDKYAVGIFASMDQAMEKLWMLRSLNYETYIVAFKDAKKVRVKEALASL